MKATRRFIALGKLQTLCALVFIAKFFACIVARANEAVPPLVSTIATTTLDPTGRPWVYLVFEPNKPGLLTGRTFNVYVKSGTPNSTAAFANRGTVGATIDPTVIKVLLSRAANIGDNIGALEAQVIGLHRLLINNIDSSTGTPIDPPAMPLNQRLAAVLNRAAGDTSLGQTVDLLGLAHPAVRLARGTAWAAPLLVAVGADITIEIRERTTTGADGAMVARVSFKAGQPSVLPAPGPIVVVPDSTATGDLTIKLRWATPDPLRQSGTRHHGDVVWRVSRAFAEAQGFNTAPPSSAALDALTLSNAADVKREAGPIFPTKLFEPADVADFVADATTTYLSDNNDRYSAGGVALAEGAQFYYFVAAADALGKPGPVSAGVLATACKRVPPRVPTHLAVANVWSVATNQYLDVKWLTNALGDGTSTMSYEIFRGDDLAAHAAAQQGLLDLNANPIDPAHPTSIARVAIVADPGAAVQQTLHVADDGGGVIPSRTWWYAIRAVHQAPPGCGDIASSLGPPVFGALRDRSSPPAPAPADVAPPVVDCLRVVCINDAPTAVNVSSDPLDTSVLQFTAQCARRNRGVIAAHFRVLEGATELVPETVAVFPADEDTVKVSWTLPLWAINTSLTVRCRAESTTGYPSGFLSQWVDANGAGVDPTGNQFTLYHFLAGAVSENDLQSGNFAGDPLYGALGPPPGDWPANLHLAYSPETGGVLHPQFSFPFPARAEQYRIYRRVEDGPLTLIRQGLRSGAASLTTEDLAPPTSNGNVHYFAQMLDESGRPSAILHLGSLRFTGDKPPTPVLLGLLPSSFGGTSAAPTVTLSWVCPPEHVDRFEVFFKTAKPSTGSGSGSGISAVGNFTRVIATLPIIHNVTSKYAQLTADLFQQYLGTTKFVAPVNESFLTAKVGGGIGAGPKFSVTMNVDPTLQYSVWLRALGPGGEQGDCSRSIDFQWQPPVAPPPNIAWPARPLPPVAAFNSGIAAIDFNAVNPKQNTIFVSPNVTPVGIRIGSITGGFASVEHFSFATEFYLGNYGMRFATNPSINPLVGKTDPNSQVFAHATDPSQKLLPFVLYRQQVANTQFPNVSGDVIQASPLISKIAYSPFVDQGGTYVGAELVDPYFRWRPLPFQDLNDQTSFTLELFLVDTQPVVTGATYRYWLMRFNSLGEPIQNVPCGEVTIVNNPQ